MSLRKFFVLIIIFAFALTPKNVNAENSASTSSFGENRKELLKQIKQIRTETRQEFLQKIGKIKDERKRSLVDKINTKISEVNKKSTDKMSGTIEKLKTYLAKITEKSTALKASGTNTAGLDGLISAAQNAITAAQNSVATQTLKTYNLNITDDITLKRTVGATVSQFRLDIQTTHKTVVDAKQAVMKALSELKQITGKTMPAASSSGTTN